MKHLFYLLIIINFSMYAQEVKIAGSTYLKTDGTIYITVKDANFVIDGELTDNSASTLIIDDGDFTNNGTYTATGTVELTGDDNKTIGGTTSTSFKNLTINKTTNDIILGNEISVGGTLQMDGGRLDLRNDTIKLGEHGTLSGETDAKRIFASDATTEGAGTGAITTIQTIVRNDVKDIAGLGLTITTLDNEYAYEASKVTITRGHTSIDGTGTFTANKSASRTFTLPGIGAIDDNTTLAFEFYDSEKGPMTGSPANTDLIIFQSVDDVAKSGSWLTPIITTVDISDATSQKLTPSGVYYYPYILEHPHTGFNDLFAIGTKKVNGAALPIELVLFDAYCDNNAKHIKWATASELNNDYFILESSNDGIIFNETTQTTGAGTSNEINNYSYIDYTAESNMYYRLKQVDLDGKLSTFNIIYVSCNETKNVTEEDFIIINNPSNENISINYKGVTDSKFTYLLIDNLGRKLINESSSLNFGTIFSINKNNLSAGMYNIIIYVNDKVINQKIIISK